MSTMADAQRPKLDTRAGAAPLILFVSALLGGLAYTVISLDRDITASGAPLTHWLPYALLAGALLIALGFEFVNGFHDTANAVATVIYTRSMPAPLAVVWSGFFNFLGVLLSTGAVAFGIISLLPVELILQVGSSAGFAMVFALLFAAIIWNLGTWWLGLPASSSHTMIGSIIGVGVANAMIRGRDGTSGVDMSKALDIGKTLLFSPLIGFALAAVLLLILKVLVRKPELYAEPKNNESPPWWIRGILILTCTGVSFAHGSNDGQKGMGLIMLILIGIVPAAYALNRTPQATEIVSFQSNASAAIQLIERVAPGEPAAGDPRAVLSHAIAVHEVGVASLPAVGKLSREILDQVKAAGAVAKVPPTQGRNIRNDMYLVSEAINALLKNKATHFSPAETRTLKAFKGSLDSATRFIPLWVKVAVAIALGLGTMVGWKRIVVTVGEKIGKSHLTYAQGAAAETVAAATIFAADHFGLPVSTTHVLSSGVAGTMAANGSGIQLATVRNLLLAWVLTLPMAVLLSGALYWLFYTLL